jgi:peroxiredoxin
LTHSVNHSVTTKRYFWNCTKINFGRDRAALDRTETESNNAALASIRLRLLHFGTHLSAANDAIVWSTPPAMRRLMLTQMQAASQTAAVFARAAPEVRGDYSATAWTEMPTEVWRRSLRVRARAARPALSQPKRIAAFLFALTVILANFARDDVRAEGAVLRPWAEGQLPLFARDWLNGESTDLAQLRSGAVLVHFFATWREPCRAELTTLQQLHSRLHDRSVTIIGVDVGEADSRVRRFFAGGPASFPILLDRDRAVSRAWQVSVVPTTFLLDGNLVPRFVAVGDVDWARPEVDESVISLVRQKAVGRADRAF